MEPRDVDKLCQLHWVAGETLRVAKEFDESGETLARL